MEALRAVYASLGFDQVQTYVQSGNVVFRTRKADIAKLSTRIEDALEAAFGFRPSVIQRTLPEWRAVIAANPFAAREDIQPDKLLVTFLATDPGEDARRAFLAVPVTSEELRAAGRETFVYYPTGQGVSTLSPSLVAKALKTPGTGRNWNTVLKLLQIAEQVESAAS